MFNDDAFARWDAGQQLWKQLMLARAAGTPSLALEEVDTVISSGGHGYVCFCEANLFVHAISNQSISQSATSHSHPCIQTVAPSFRTASTRL